MYRKPVCQIKIPTFVLCLLFGSILLTASACTFYGAEQETTTPATSPVELDEPASEARAMLGEQQWLLSAVIYRGEEQEISALEPTYFQFVFNPDRNTMRIVTPCEGTDSGVRGLGPTIVFYEEQQYRLYPQEMIGVGCGEMIDAQSDYLMGTYLETSHYELRNDQLLLIGDNNQIVLERVNTNP
jgi:hypothetical protein